MVGLRVALEGARRELSEARARISGAEKSSAHRTEEAEALKAELRAANRRTSDLEAEGADREAGHAKVREERAKERDERDGLNRELSEVRAREERLYVEAILTPTVSCSSLCLSRRSLGRRWPLPRLGCR